MSEQTSLRIGLLDLQIVDSERLPIGRVDDVELEVEPGSARVVALLTGAEALGERIGGSSGRALAAAAARMRSEPGPPRIAPELVDQIGAMVRLRAPFEQLPQLAALERWLSRHLVSRIPGGGDAPR